MTTHLTNSDIMRLARQIENCNNKMDDYARRIEDSDHPSREAVLIALREEGIFYTVCITDIVRKVLEEQRP